jgi:hypothetical protein
VWRKVGLNVVMIRISQIGAFQLLTFSNFRRHRKGGRKEGSITAEDPIRNKQVLYLVWRKVGLNMVMIRISQICAFQLLTFSDKIPAT